MIPRMTWDAVRELALRLPLLLHTDPVEATRPQMRELLEDAWRRVAPKRPIAEHDRTA